MPTLAAIDVSVTDSRISFTFSHRAVAQAYAKHVESLDRRPSQAIPNYRRSPSYNPTTKEVTVALPSFMTWFITCRLPDDEDCITFTFVDRDEQQATRWAESMVLFEPVHDESHKQLQVRRLWNTAKLTGRLEDLRRKSSSSSATASPRRGPTPGPGARENRNGNARNVNGNGNANTNGNGTTRHVRAEYW